MHNFNVDDVGKFFLGPSLAFHQDKQQHVWKVIAFAELPSVTLIDLETGEKITGCIGSSNLRPFKALEAKEE